MEKDGECLELDEGEPAVAFIEEEIRTELGVDVVGVVIEDELAMRGEGETEGGGEEEEEEGERIEEYCCVDGCWGW